eukprot:6255678-Amphidinium_carterae.1
MSRLGGVDIKGRADGDGRVAAHKGRAGSDCKGVELDRTVDRGGAFRYVGKVHWATLQRNVKRASWPR